MQGKPKIHVKYEEVPKYHITGFFGGLNPNEGSISFYHDNLVPTEGLRPGQIILDHIEQKFVAEIRMSPFVFKRMALWMMDHVKKYEADFGEIDIGPPKKKKPSESSGHAPFYG